MSEMPAQPEQQGEGSAGAAAAADLGQRLLAKLIDYIILWVVGLIVFTSVLGMGMFGGAGFGGAAFLSGVLWIAMYLAYFIAMEMTTGQTLGKMVLKLRVRGAAGDNPTLEEALKRNAWMIPGIVPVLGGLVVLAAAIYILVTINNNTATRQGWHDEFAGGTSVIKQ